MIAKNRWLVGQFNEVVTSYFKDVVLPIDIDKPLPS